MDIRFHLNLSAEQYRKYYAGTVKSVQVKSEDGQTVRFPASLLRPYLTHDGIRGYFRIEYDDRQRFRKIEKLA